ncbi:hypothetical protein ACLOJK_018757, partial [Asimina triloba]
SHEHDNDPTSQHAADVVARARTRCPNASTHAVANIVNVGSAVDDRHFALKAAAKAAVPAATVLDQIFYK